MSFPAPALRVRLDRPDLVRDLVDALAAGDCFCARGTDDTLVVVHPTAADEREARLELGFFLRAWATAHGAKAEVL